MGLDFWNDFSTLPLRASHEFAIILHHVLTALKMLFANMLTEVQLSSKSLFAKTALVILLGHVAQLQVLPSVARSFV